MIEFEEPRSSRFCQRHDFFRLEFVVIGSFYAAFHFFIGKLVEERTYYLKGYLPVAHTLHLFGAKRQRRYSLRYIKASVFRHTLYYRPRAFLKLSASSRAFVIHCASLMSFRPLSFVRQSFILFMVSAKSS